MIKRPTRVASRTARMSAAEPHADSHAVAVSPVDGIPRSLVEERRLNDLAARLATSEEFQQYFAYLKSITINRVQGPHVTDAELRHIEGQRFNVAITERRIDLGRQRKPELPGE